MAHDTNDGPSRDPHVPEGMACDLTHADPQHVAAVDPQVALLAPSNVGLNSFPVPAGLVDRAGLVLRAPNLMLADLLGWPLADLAGRPLADLVHPAHMRRIERALEQQPNGSTTLAIRMASPEGTPIDVRVAFGPLTPQAAEAAPSSTLIVTFNELAPTPSEDGQDSGQDAATVAGQNAESAEADASAAGALVQRLGHDLRHPLTIVAGYAQMLASGGPELDRSTRDHVLASLATAAMRAAEQVTSMLEGSHSRAMGEAQTVDLGDVAGWIEGLTALQFERIGGMLVIDIEDAVVPVDGTILRQVLLNLVNNALSHASEDRPLTLHLSSRVVADGLELIVTDNGRGIPDTQLEEIFTPGVRLNPTHAAGLGSGLAASRGLAEQIGGMLAAVPYEPGARFVLWLPLEKEEQADQAATSQARPSIVRFDRAQRGEKH